MATPTYELLDSEVLSSSASSMTFTSIPATYRDLVLVVDVTTDNVRDWTVRFNSNSTGYSTVWMYGDGTSAISQFFGSGTLHRWQETVVGKGMFIMQIMDYSATDKHKTSLIRSNTNERVHAIIGRWANTSAVNSVAIAPISGANFLTGSTFYLYGIA